MRATVAVRAALALALMASGSSPSPFAVRDRSPGGDASRSARLDEIRADLEQLRFEEALSEIEAFLTDRALPEELRVEALVLRAQAHIAYGDLDATEADYRELVRLRPAYTPEVSLIPPKALKRFEQVRRELVGTLKLTTTPRQVDITVDGREVARAADGSLPVLAGERQLRFSRAGFDPWEINVEVVAAAEQPLEVVLIPNARTIVLQTDPEGVVVTMDGQIVGETERAGRGLLAELVLEHVPLGEHDFEFSKPCYRTALYRDLLTVDLSDTSPKVYEPVRLEAARSELAVRGAPPGSELRVDDQRTGPLTGDVVQLCPGDRTLELRAGGRIVWRSREQLPIDDRLTLVVKPRPNVVLVGGGWPVELDDLASRVSTLDQIDHDGAGDLEDSEAWRSLPLPDDTDLALAVLPGRTRDAGQRWVLYSPWLRSTVLLKDPGVDWRQPEWTTSVLGAFVVDSFVGGPARVAGVRAGGPAAAKGLTVGDRLIALNGEPVVGATELRRRIAAARPGEPVVLEVVSGDGKRRTLELSPGASPRLYAPPRRHGVQGLMLAAWAAVDAVAGERAWRDTARANLALLLADAGRTELALETWRRVGWEERSGIGAGTVGYYTGRLLEALSREREAVEAFRRAARSDATTFHDDGPPVAGAARDHLFDLGVSPAR